MNQNPQFDEETRNSVDFQFYDKNLKFHYSDNTFLKSIDTTLHQINDKLGVIAFIMLLPIILNIAMIIFAIISFIAGGVSIAGLLQELINNMP